MFYKHFYGFLGVHGPVFLFETALRWLPGATRRREALPGATRRYPALPGAGKVLLMLPGAGKSPEMPKSATQRQERDIQRWVETPDAGKRAAVLASQMPARCRYCYH